jgi:tetratricopeptide (TPR) repeat protein
LDEIKKVIGLRDSKNFEEALKLVLSLLSDSPNDPEINYQTAWTYDCLGEESKAAPYYENAIKLGLKGKSLKGAFLGLGSTYRCLGRYQDSIKIFDEAIKIFPEENSLRVFRALCLYNLGDFEHSVSELLTLLLNTTNDSDIKSYEKALRFYSNRLNETWN